MMEPETITWTAVGITWLIGLPAYLVMVRRDRKRAQK